MRILKKLSLAFCLLCWAGTVSAQDVIVKKDQSTVMSKVLEITSTEIKYKKWNNQDGPTYSINRSEVVNINYENGEVERVSDNTINQLYTHQKETQQTLIGFMDISGNNLKINGHILTDREVQNLVDEQSYQLYLKGKRQNDGGDVFLIVGGGITGGGLGAMIGSVNNPETMGVALIIAMTGIITTIPGWILSSVGTNKLKQVAENYNLIHGNAYSFNISPSLMKCEIPQSQGNYGLGLTLNMNF